MIMPVRSVSSWLNSLRTHARSGELAVRTVAVLEQSQATLNKRSDQLASEAVELADKAFALPSGRDGIHAEIRAFIRSKAKAEGGLAEIRQVVGSDIEAASVLCATPHYLLDLSKDVHETIWGDAVKQHVPKAAIALSQADDIEKVAAKYPDTIAKVKASFYSPALANKANSRVEV